MGLGATGLAEVAQVPAGGLASGAVGRREDRQVCQQVRQRSPAS